MKRWTLDEIVKWHEKNMPGATLESQLLKLEEEFKELAACDPSSKEFGEELADVCICCMILSGRFKSVAGSYIYNTTMDSAPEHMQADLVKYICDKMDKNAARKWVETKPGYYRHEDD